MKKLALFCCCALLTSVVIADDTPPACPTSGSELNLTGSPTIVQLPNHLASVFFSVNTSPWKSAVVSNLKDNGQDAPLLEAAREHLRDLPSYYSSGTEGDDEEPGVTVYQCFYNGENSVTLSTKAFDFSNLTPVGDHHE